MCGPHLLLYDGACGFCRALAERARIRDRQHRFRILPYQEAPSPPMTPALAEACARALHVLAGDGRILGGGRALLFFLEATGPGRAARILARPPLLGCVELAYRIVARHRSFFSRLLNRGLPPSMNGPWHLRPKQN